MGAYWVRSPKWLKYIFRKRIWHLNSSSKIMYLTFDDGPTPEVTPFVLQTLEEFNAKATFFCIGNNVEKFPKIFKSIHKAGHTIGNHTQQHLNGWKTPTTHYINDCLVAEKSLYNSKNIKNKKLFRPPYGKCTQQQRRILKEKGYDIIMWSVLSADFDLKISPQKCLNNVLKNATSGNIILFHDSIKAKQNIEYALPKVLEYFSKKGYQFKSIDTVNV